MPNLPKNALSCRHSIDDGFLLLEDKELRFYRISFEEHMLQHTWKQEEISSVKLSESLMGNEIEVLFYNHSKLHFYSNQDAQAIQDWIEHSVNTPGNPSNSTENAESLPSEIQPPTSQNLSDLTAEEPPTTNDVEKETPQDQSDDEELFSGLHIDSKAEQDIQEERSEDVVTSVLEDRPEVLSLEQINRKEQEQRVQEFMSSVTSTNSNYLNPFFPSPMYVVFFIIAISFCFPIGVFIYIGMVYKHNKDAAMSSDDQ